MLVVCSHGGHERHVLDAAVETAFLSTGHMLDACAPFWRLPWSACQDRSDRCASACAIRSQDREHSALFFSSPETAALRALHARRTEIQQIRLLRLVVLDHGSAQERAEEP